MEKPLIREGKPADLEQIVKNNMAMALETEGKVLNPEKARRGAEAVLSGIVDGKYYVVESGGRIVAQLMITREWSDWRNCYFWWIQSVYTLPEERGKGYFGLLYKFVLQKASEAGACGLRLYVDRSNQGAMKVYEKYGMARSNYEMFEEEF